MSTSLVVGNMIGAGIFLMPAALAPYGGISILGWLFSATGAILLAKVFGKLSHLVPGRSGGPYAYSKAGFGDFVGFLVAWGYWISIWVSNAAIAIAFVSALSVFWPLLQESTVWAVSFGTGTIWGLTWVNSLGVRASGKLQLFTTILKLLPLVLIIVGGFFFFDLEHFVPFNRSSETTFGAITITAALTLYAYMGVESATIPASDVARPEKTIPKATLFGTVLTALVYILGTVAVMGIIPLEELAVSPAPFADASAVIGGEWGRTFVAAGAAIAAFGGLNGWILVQGQVAMATAQDHLFPSIFQRKNRKGVPVYGILIGSALSSIVLLMNYTDGLVDQFRFLILLTALCVLIPYLFSAAAYVLLAIRPKMGVGHWLPVVGLGGLAFIYALWAVYGAGEKAIFWGFLLLLTGIPVYVYMKRRL